jgi:1,4-dihydroxy-2-naphthoate octaprenyltransferase
MTIARHGAGPVASLRALASQIHPIFMLPAVATSAAGAVIAREVSFALAALHVVIVFCELYTAHVKDGYIDFYRRGEDDDHPLTARGCRLALAGASLLVFVGIGIIYVVVGLWAALLTLPGWLIAYFHAPQLDMHPLTATTGYPLGIAFTLVSGYYVQAGSLSLTALAVAAVLLVLLSGIKVIDDAKDYDYDRSIDKRTVAVVLGRKRARRSAFVLMASGLVVVTVLAVLTSVLPISSVGGVIAFAGIAALTRRMDAKHTTMILIRGSYVFLAFLIAAVWFQPLE